MRFNFNLLPIVDNKYILIVSSKWLRKDDYWHQKALFDTQRQGMWIQCTLRQGALPIRGF